MIKGLSLREQSKLVMEKPVAAKLIDDLHIKVQMELVDRNPTYIRFIKNPAKAVQLKAVESSACLIAYIKNPSEKVQIAALMCDLDSAAIICQFGKLSRKVQEVMVSELISANTGTGQLHDNINGLYIFPRLSYDDLILTCIEFEAKWAREFSLSPELQLKVVRNNWHTILHIKNPCREAQLAALEEVKIMHELDTEANSGNHKFFLDDVTKMMDNIVDPIVEIQLAYLSCCADFLKDPKVKVSC